MKWNDFPLHHVTTGFVSLSKTRPTLTGLLRCWELSDQLKKAFWPNPTCDESTSKELDIERDLRRLYIPDNYKSKVLQTRISNPLFQIMIPNRNYKSVDDNSCWDRGFSSMRRDDHAKIVMRTLPTASVCHESCVIFPKHRGQQFKQLLLELGLTRVRTQSH